MRNSSVREPTVFPSKTSVHAGSKTGSTQPIPGSAGCPFSERRKQTRSAFTAAATIMEPDSGTRIEAHTTDICLGGCYVDTMNGFPAGTIVELRLTKDGKSFHSVAKVVCSQASVGMGLSFSAVEQEQFLLLEQWFGELRAERIHEPHTLEQDESSNCGIEQTLEMRYALEDLLVQLMRKGILTEEEGEPILRRLLH